MARYASLLSILAVLAPSPALAREERTEIDVPASRLDQGLRMLGRQTGTSIGFRDAAVSRLRIRAVSGTLSAGEALVMMLRGSGARARRVAPETFLVELDPDFHKPKPGPAPAHRAPAPAPPFAEPPPVEIVVTGTKRDIPFDVYPGMVHIVDGDRISPAGGRHGSDAIEASTPSVASTHLGPGRNKLFIRGIADSSFVGPTQATVGQYWGNSRITYSAPDPSLKLYDVRRIEVLEGPQGTLYGAGSLGGVVRVVPREPLLDRVEGNAWAGVEAIQHGQPGMDGGAVVNLPLVEDRLGLRAVAFASTENGYIDDVGRDLKDVNDVDSIGGRLSLRYQDENDWTVDLSLVGQRIDGKDSQYSERDRGDLARSSGMAQPFRNDFLLADVVVRKTLDDVEFTGTLGYAYQNVFEAFEGPALADVANTALRPMVNAPAVRFSQLNRIDMFNAEARLSRSAADGTGWLIAATMLDNRDVVRRQTGMVGSEIPMTGVGNKVREVTGYGEFTFSPLDHLNITAGGRLTHSRLAGEVRDPVGPLLAYAVDPSAKASRTETEALPSLALAYRPSATTTLFLRYQEGFRPGGIAVRREFIQRYQGDRVRAIEGGIRYRGERLELEASTSWSGWHNIQADVVDGFGFPTTTNVGDGRVWSTGISGRWRPLPGFEIDGALYVNRSKVTERDKILASLAPDSDGTAFRRLPNIADKTGRLGVTLYQALDANHDLELTGFGRYVGKSVLGVGPVLGKLQGDYLDTGFEATLRTGRFRYSLSVSNLLDSKGNRFALGSPFQVRDRNQITPLQPRSLRIGVQMDF